MDVKLRAPRLKEATEIAAMLNEHSQALWGVDSLSTAEIEHWFSTPGLEPEHDMRVAVGSDGALLGYADVNNGGVARTRFWIDLRLRPGTDEAVGHALVEPLEARARKRTAPGGLSRGIYAGTDDVLRRIFEARGYELVRHSLRMEAPLDEEPEAPVWRRG